MHQIVLALGGAWKVLIAGLVLGAGLPALFAIGIRAMAFGAGGSAETSDGGQAKPHRIGTVIGIICFGLVVAIALLGIGYIVASGFGKTISFENIYPTIVDK